ncbi:MAG: DUF1080 domain-containing protein [Thermoguttaceae bacterium]|nr:DUF1080 domain-containing protein [Thermoguttaceae bacterium]
MMYDLWKTGCCMVFALFLLQGALAAAEDKVDGTAPPVQSGFLTMTEEEIQDGWLQLFDGRTLFGWTAGSPEKTRDAKTENPSIRVKNGQMTIATRLPVRLRTPVLLSEKTEIVFQFRRLSSDLVGSVYLVTEDGNEENRIGKFEFSADIPLSMSETGTISVTDEPWQGQNYLEIEVKRGELMIESVRYRMTGPRKLDLTSDDQSDWRIVELQAENQADGTLLLSGQGQLESRESFDNFLFQCDFLAGTETGDSEKSVCNSGLFFRSVPESKLDGYECQINNVPPESDRTKFLGNDTGSIFRRAAARRLTDRRDRWTSLAVMQNDKMIRTWVNGIPAVVWVDDRKPDANPRRGFRADAGTFQIQGHDPWTRIFFRNIRVSTP